MKQLILSTMMLFALAPVTVFSQKKAVLQVEKSVQKLNEAMVQADAAQLRNLTYEDLKYGHSSGVIQNQEAFIEGIVSGKSDFVSIKNTQQTIDVVGHTATVRHLLSAETFDNKVPGHVTLEILLVWVKKHGEWRLLARQAVKPPVKK